MILDKIENAGLYKGIHPGIDKILSLATTFTADNYPTEQLFLDGENLFINFPQYETKSRDSEGAIAEAHRAYIDVMYMVDGCETIYVKNTDDLKAVTREYDESIEALLAKIDDDTTAVRLTAGSFVILFPQDAHAPSCDPLPEKSVKVKKFVGKVKI